LCFDFVCGLFDGWVGLQVCVRSFCVYVLVVVWFCVVRFLLFLFCTLVDAYSVVVVMLWTVLTFCSFCFCVVLGLQTFGCVVYVWLAQVHRCVVLVHGFSHSVKLKQFKNT